MVPSPALMQVVCVCKHHVSRCGRGLHQIPTSATWHHPHFSRLFSLGSNPIDKMDSEPQTSTDPSQTWIKHLKCPHLYTQVQCIWLRFWFADDAIHMNCADN